MSIVCHTFTVEHFSHLFLYHACSLMSFWQLNPKRLIMRSLPPLWKSWSHLSWNTTFMTWATFKFCMLLPQVRWQLQSGLQLEVKKYPSTVQRTCPKVAPTLLSMKHVASGVIVEFMKSLYITGDGNHKVSLQIDRKRVSWQARQISKLTALPATENEVHRVGILVIPS